MYEIKEMKSIAKALNNRVYTDYYYRLMLLARAVFKWENLPNGIDEKWIEKYLFLDGKCMFFKDKILGFMVSKCNGSMLNHYDEYAKLQPVANNYSNVKWYSVDEDCVLISNNDCQLPTYPTIELYALRLAEISRAIDVNVKAQKTAVLIKGTEKQRVTLKNLFKQWDGNEPVVYGDDDLSLDSLQALKTDAPVVFDKLQIQKHAIWNECMTFLGINNANQDKRERLVADEVDANDEQIEMSAQIFLKAREEACKRINEIFKLDKPVKVSIRSSEEIKRLLEGSETDSKGSESLGGDE